MSFATRLGVFAIVSIAGLLAWQWTLAADPSHDVTALAVQQFANSDAVAATLQETTLTRNYWPLIWPALWALAAAVMFWDDLERLWKRDNS